MRVREQPPNHAVRGRHGGALQQNALDFDECHVVLRDAVLLAQLRQRLSQLLVSPVGDGFAAFSDV